MDTMLDQCVIAWQPLTMDTLSIHYTLYERGDYNKEIERVSSDEYQSLQYRMLRLKKQFPDKRYIIIKEMTIVTLDTY